MSSSWLSLSGEETANKEDDFRRVKVQVGSCKGTATLEIILGKEPILVLGLQAQQEQEHGSRGADAEENVQTRRCRGAGADEVWGMCRCRCKAAKVQQDADKMLLRSMCMILHGNAKLWQQ